MSSGGLLGIAGVVFATYFAPNTQLAGDIPLWAYGLLAAMLCYLGFLWRSAAGQKTPES